MALGASRWSVIQMVLLQAMALVALGLVIGAVGAFYLSSTAEAFLFNMNTDDPRVFEAAIGALTLAALLASIIPARRAASVDPMIALRAE
jgi:putative ABC transport system permease protein